jgi:hypothetical protein
LGQNLLRSVKSIHTHHIPFVFRTMMMFASHSGYFISLMKPTSNNLCTSTFAASTFSSTILQSFCFLCFALGLTCSRCSMTSLLTPTKSEVDHANTSFFLSSKLNSFYLLFLACLQAYTYSFLQNSRVKGTFLNSPSASIVFLCSVRGLALHWSDCSHKKWMFLCPGGKPFLMFLSSCWLPKTDMIPKVTGILRQRYAECKAASKIFKRPLPKMALYGYGMSTISKVMYSV